MIQTVVWITHNDHKEIFMGENANSIKKIDENVNEDIDLGMGTATWNRNQNPTPVDLYH